MNRKQFGILLVLVILLGAAGLAIYNKKNDTSKGGDPTLGRKLLGDLPVNDITAIAVKQGTNEVNLVKKDNLWRVRERADYAANYSEISDFLLKARDLKVLETEKVAPADLGRLALVPGDGTNTALVVEFKGTNGAALKTLLLGKKHMRKSNRPSPYGDMGDDQGWPDGRYVKLGAESDSVALISDPLANIEPKPEQWLNKDFFKVEKARSIEVVFPEATNSWKVSRETETGEWKLADAKPGEQLDSSKTSALTNPLNFPSFNDVAAGAALDSLGLEKPTTVSIETFDGFSYLIKVGSKTNDNYAVTVAVSTQFPKERTSGKDEKPEDKARLDKEFKDKQTKLEEKATQEKALGKWVYLVSNWTFEPLLKDRAQLLVEKKEEAKPGEKPAPDGGASTNAPGMAVEPSKPS